jgi:hypothetical protein
MLRNSCGNRCQSPDSHHLLRTEQAIGPVIKELTNEGYNILVIDGYSTDITPDLLKTIGIRTVQQHCKGKTGALRTAIDH